MSGSVRVAWVVLACLVIVPPAAYAQASITGVVKDTSGAVLPGVTVEAASPALIERARNVVTGETGQYRIENLRPGVYTVTFAHNFGKQIRNWDGVEITVNARPRSGLVFQGGMSTGRTTTDNCDIVDDLPEVLLGAQNVGQDNANASLPAPNCRQQSEFLTQVKFLGTYTLPRIDVQLTATVQSVPGPQIVANYVATNAVVAPNLGRNLSGRVANMTVNIVEPGTMYGERMNQLDVRIGKILRFERTRATVSLDLYNALNASPVLTQSSAFATWQRPQSILNPRFAKVVPQFDF